MGLAGKFAGVLGAGNEGAPFVGILRGLAAGMHPAGSSRLVSIRGIAVYAIRLGVMENLRGERTDPLRGRSEKARIPSQLWEFQEGRSLLSQVKRLF